MSFLQLRAPFIRNYPLPPTVTTNAASNGTATGADGNGNVSTDGGSTITERGFVWSTNSNPTTADSKLIVAGTTGSYTGTMTPLSNNTTYHYRAYAINGIGTAYGDDTTFMTTVGVTADMWHPMIEQPYFDKLGIVGY